MRRLFCFNKLFWIMSSFKFWLYAIKISFRVKYQYLCVWFKLSYTCHCMIQSVLQLPLYDSSRPTGATVWFKLSRPNYIYPELHSTCRWAILHLCVYEPLQKSLTPEVFSEHRGKVRVQVVMFISPIQAASFHQPFHGAFSEPKFGCQVGLWPRLYNFFAHKRQCHLAQRLYLSWPLFLTRHNRLPD